MSDHRLRWLIDDTDVRGVLVQLDRSQHDALATHHYPPAVRRLLGEFMAATAAMAATLKFDGSLILQAQGEGELPLIMAEASSTGALRAIAHHSEQVLGDDFSSLLTPGRLSLTIDPERGNRYQGIVPLEGPSLGACLEHYFAHSEQLATRIWLAGDGERSGALLLQELPATRARSGEVRAERWQHLSTLAETVSDEELLTLDPVTLLHRLYHSEPLRLLGTDTLRFACSCSRSRTESMLRSLGRAELESVLAEQGEVTVNCEFCNQLYHFDAAAVAALFTAAPPH